MGSLLSIYEKGDQANLKTMTDFDNDEFYDALDEIKSGNMNVNDSHTACSENQEGLVTDAVESKYIQSYMSPSSISYEKISEIEKNLKYYEKVSLVFLLYDNEDTALQTLLVEQANLKRGMSTNLLSDWAKSKHVSTSSWQNKFIEALCVIQNYAALKRLGFDKEDMKMRYLPTQPYTSLHLNRIMKALYCVCEQLTGNETMLLREYLKSEFERLNLQFNNYGEHQLELYLLHCFSLKYIEKNDLSNLIRLLKKLNHVCQADMLESVTNEVTHTCSNEIKCTFDLTKPTQNYANSNEPSCSQYSVIGDNSIVRKAASTDNDVYKIIDPKNVGICLIINQKKFYKEKRKSCNNDFGRLLEPKHDLEERHGTDVDRDSLAKLFKKLGFIIVIKENLTNGEMIPTIKKVMGDFSKNHSCFFICILSHGVENKIYGANSRPVDIEDIVDAMHDRQFSALLGKPKILIIQSCQGTELQKVHVPPDDNVTDGPNKNSEYNTINETSGIPQKLDFLLCMSTVSGFASIRNKTTGTWYIQELCKILDDNCDKEHFADIMTKVTRAVSNKRWEKANGTVTMVPEQNKLTLCAKLFLRKVKEGE